MSSPSSSQSPALVLIHGLYSSPREFAMITRALDARGVEHHALAISGYTSDFGARCWERHEWVEGAYREVWRRFGDRPIVIAGLCAGAGVAASLVLQGWCRNACALAMLSPTFAFDSWGNGPLTRFRRIAYRTGLDRLLSVAERHPFGIKDDRIRDVVLMTSGKADDPAFMPMRLPLRGIRETELLFGDVSRSLHRLDVPLVVVHATDDEIATVESAKKGIAAAPPGTRFVELADCYHMITIDRERAAVADILGDLVGAPARIEPATDVERMLATRRSERAAGEGAAVLHTPIEWLVA